MRKEKSKVRLPLYLKVFLVGLGVSIISWGSFYLYYQFFLSPEDKIKSSISLIVLSAEQKAAKAVMLQISENYSDSVGQDKKMLGQNMRYWCAKNLQEEIDINVDDIKIELAPDKKSADVTFTVSGNKPVEAVLKYARSNGKFRIKYVDENGLWQISHYEPVK